MAPRILIADDHEMMRLGLRSFLQAHREVEVLEASDGREAVEKTAESKPDLVILDISMPVMDGFSAAREIKRVAPETPILILTFQKNDTLAETARKIGVNGYLTKGEDSAALLRAIDGAIGSPAAKSAERGNSRFFAAAAGTQLSGEQASADTFQARPEARTRPLLRVLFFHSDTAWMVRCLKELEALKFQISSDVISTAEQFAERLSSKSYDVVVAEYPIPEWQTSAALDLLRRRHIPLILVASKLELEEAADLIAEGVADCVEMENVRGLPIAIRRALKENKARGERRRVERKLLDSEAHYRALMGNPAFGICRCGMEGEFLEVNEALAAMLGYESAERLLAVNFAGDILRDNSRRSQLLGELDENNRVEPLETEWKRNDGTGLKVRLSGRPVSTEAGKRDGYEIIVEDVTKQRELENELRQQAARDPLTGLANWRQLAGALENEIERSKSTGRQFALLLFDLDGLKEINRRYGHITGSEALCRLADVLAAGCRDIDTAARFGGDEFAVILPETGAEAARMVAQRLCDNLEGDARVPKVTASVGIAVYPADGEAMDMLVTAADVEMYAMKEQVKARCRNA